MTVSCSWHIDRMAARRFRSPVLRNTRAPFLKRIEGTFQPGQDAYPFNIPAFEAGIDVSLRTAVTFLVGENGSGKSTLLDALAECCGFNPEGGNRGHHRATS